MARVVIVEGEPEDNSSSRRGVQWGTERNGRGTSCSGTSSGSSQTTDDDDDDD